MNEAASWIIRSNLEIFHSQSPSLMHFSAIRLIQTPTYVKNRMSSAAVSARTDSLEDGASRFTSVTDDKREAIHPEREGLGFGLNTPTLRFLFFYILALC